MVIDDVLQLRDTEQSILKEQLNFNCRVSVIKDGESVNYYFDDYRVAQAIINLLDNVRFVYRK